MLDNDFSIEHIFPNSSDWDGEIDKDRTGNLIPIISTINCSRQNKHIDAYKETKGGKEFFSFIKDIIEPVERHHISKNVDKLMNQHRKIDDKLNLILSKLNN